METKTVQNADDFLHRLGRKIEPSSNIVKEAVMPSPVVIVARIPRDVKARKYVTIATPSTHHRDARTCAA